MGSSSWFEGTCCSSCDWSWCISSRQGRQMPKICTMDQRPGGSVFHRRAELDCGRTMIACISRGTFGAVVPADWGTGVTWGSLSLALRPLQSCQRLLST